MSEPVSASPNEPLPLWLAALPLVVLLTVFAGGALFTELGGTLVVVAILLAAVVAGLIGFSRGISWQLMEQAAVAKFGDVFPVVLILLSIGGLIGSWMLCGTIPFFVWTGIHLIDPDYLYTFGFSGRCYHEHIYRLVMGFGRHNRRCFNGPGHRDGGLFTGYRRCSDFRRLLR